jgi:hypothetical protein
LHPNFTGFEPCLKGLLEGDTKPLAAAKSIAMEVEEKHHMLVFAREITELTASPT